MKYGGRGISEWLIRLSEEQEIRMEVIRKNGGASPTLPICRGRWSGGKKKANMEFAHQLLVL